MPTPTSNIRNFCIIAHIDHGKRSLAACEGAILLVDAFQGVQAQTVANAFLAMEANLKLIPTLNKIDLPHARPDFVIGEMETAVFTVPEEVMKVSAKAGLGIEELLEVIIDRVPCPSGSTDAPLKALIYNSHFDTYKG